MYLWKIAGKGEVSIFENPQNSPSENLPQKPEQITQSAPWSGSSASLNKLYNEIYYSRRVQKALESDSDAFQEEVTKRVKTRLVFRISYNALFLVSLIFVALNISRAWFTENQVTEIRQTILYVHNSSIPVYLSASFNNTVLDEYTNEEISMAKTVIPGDVVNISVFIDLRGIAGVRAVELKVSDIPSWIKYLEDFPDLTFADITTGEDVLPLELATTPGGMSVSLPVISDGAMTFRIIDIPENYDEYDGLCLKFQVYFEDTFQNQNEYMNQILKLRFSAKDVS